jgi:hypothetical protein
MQLFTTWYYSRCFSRYFFQPSAAVVIPVTRVTRETGLVGARSSSRTGSEGDNRNDKSWMAAPNAALSRTALNRKLISAASPKRVRRLTSAGLALSDRVGRNSDRIGRGVRIANARRTEAWKASLSTSEAPPAHVSNACATVKSRSS